MRKAVFLFSAVIFALSFLFLYFHPAAVQALQAALNTSDLMFPFSIYRGIIEHTSGPDWVFGGYTPFLELAAGFAIWLAARDIQLTYVVYAILQPAVVALCLAFLASCLVGKNGKVQRLVVISAAAPILVYAAGHLLFLYAYFSWYLHITTACMALIVCAFSIQYLTDETAGKLSGKKLFRPALLYLFAISAAAILSDPIFLSQSIVPMIAVVAGLVILRVLPFRKGAAAGLVLMYAAAAGLALYQLPRLWGSDRIVLYGSYMKPALERIRENWPILLNNLAAAFEGRLWIAALCGLFYVLCLTAGVVNLYELRQNGQGRLRKRLVLFYFYLPAQMAVSAGASLIANDPSPRYFYPAMFFPLFWGWPFLLIAVPGWMKAARRNAARVIPYAAFAALLLTAQLWASAGTPLDGSSKLPRPSVSGGDYGSPSPRLPVSASPRLPISLPPLPNLLAYYPAFNRCLDEAAGRFRLHRGVAHYWQARQATLLSRSGLFVAQVTPDLAPLRILNNASDYRGDFDFVIIDNAPPPGNWVDREAVLRRFGQPAAVFSCASMASDASSAANGSAGLGSSEILVYNRPGDTAFRSLFAAKK